MRAPRSRACSRLSSTTTPAPSADTKPSGNLRVDDRKGLLVGGNSGPAFVPGKPRESLLLKRVTQKEAKRRMPLEGEALSEEQLAILAKWIEDGADPVHSEFRDDHFAAAFDRASDSPAVFTAAYIVRAVSPGTYVLPQAYVEDMYRPDRYGRTATGTVTVTAAGAK